LAGKLLSESTDSALTIVVPVHNISGRLSHLSSWLDQAKEFNVKVILVHDQSDDSTGAELEELIRDKRCQNFSILNVEERSPGLARNTGLLEVDTRWFSFADADDTVYISALVKLLKETEASGSDLGIGAYSSVDIKTDSECLMTPPNNNEEALAIHVAQTMGLWRFLFLSEKFKEVRFTRYRMGEDFAFANIVLNQSVRIHTSSEIVYRYFHGGELNLTSNKSIMNEMLGVIEVIKSFEVSSRIGSSFSNFAIQKLSMSAIKNLPLKEARARKIILCVNLILHPIALMKLVFSPKTESELLKRD
jgi:glycosyltransferase involved in cell wall biosynthesis